MAFRFHRLSQVSRDLFDAYRNLFLAFEALLDQLFPKGRKEQEKLWLERAVGAAAARVDIPALGLDYVIDPVKEVVDRVYRIRVQLFHAKTGRTIVPEERVGYVAVAETYAELLRLWTAIARAWLGYHSRSGVITNAGFRQLIDNAYTGSRFAVTSDDTPPTKLDVDPSPQGLPVGTFGAPVVIDGAIHGAVTLRSRASLVELAPVTTVGRVCLLNREAQNMLATSMSGSLDLDGVAELEIECVLKLANIGQPRLDFG